jgi:hypothetical protein
VHGYTAPEHLIVTHNILTGNDDYGIIFGGANDVAAHNILYKNYNGGVFFFRDGCKKGVVVNKIFVEPGDAGAIGYDHNPSGNLVDYVCLSPETKLCEPVAGNTHGEHSVKADPMLVDAEQLDFHLKKGSPCMGAGDKHSGTYWGNAPDMGWYQSGSGEVKGKQF